MLSIYLVAHGKHGGVSTSNVLSPYVVGGSGTYVKVEEDNYAEPIMKRALGFVSTSQAMTRTSTTQRVLTDIDGYILTDSDGKILSPAAEIALHNRDDVQFVDVTGRALFTTATTLLENTSGWSVVQKSYTKDADDTWRTNDITYEVLQVFNEQTGKYEVLNDFVNNPIYIL
jgi:hypothetical protein